jgi:hypothetical protein
VVVEEMAEEEELLDKAAMVVPVLTHEVLVLMAPQALPLHFLEQVVVVHRVEQGELLVTVLVQAGVLVAQRVRILGMVQCGQLPLPELVFMVLVVVVVVPLALALAQELVLAPTVEAMAVLPQMEEML